MRIGAHLNPAHLKRGFHTTATVAPFAAATAVGLLLGLDADRLTRALGLAGLQGAGLMEVFHDGAMAKPFQTARGSAAGLLAADLAARGALARAPSSKASKAFWRRCAATARPTTSWPAWARTRTGRSGASTSSCTPPAATPTPPSTPPACSATSTTSSPEQVERVAGAHLLEVADHLCGATALPSGPSEAKFSLPFTVALGLTFGHARQSCFTPETRRRRGATVARLARPRRDRSRPWSAPIPVKRTAAVDLMTVDGRLLQAEVPIARGEPEIPLSQEDIEAKFLDNARAALSEEQAQAIIAEVRALDTRPSCTRLLDLLAGRATPALTTR